MKEDDEYSCIDCKFFNVSATYKNSLYSEFDIVCKHEIAFTIKYNRKTKTCYVYGIGKKCELFELSFSKIIENILNKENK